MPRCSVPRLKDVAQEANVSLSAASRILRGKGDRYALETRNRVLRASKDMGWRQNLLVSGIQSGQTKTIGVMIPPFDSYWVGVLDGIHTTLADSDYLPITVWPSGWRELGVFESQKEEGFELISRLLDRRVDGLILWPTYAVAYREHFRDLIERAVPVGVIDHSTSNGGLTDVVETDDQKGAAAVAQYLMKRGHRRIACFSTREIEAQTWAIRRREAFEAKCGKRKTVQCRSWKIDPSGDKALQVAIELLSSDFRPTAVFCVSDHEARLIYTAACQLGLSIPKDISVVGFNNLDFAENLHPPLTTMRLNSEEMGKAVAEMILKRLNEDMQKTSVVTIEAQLVERDSVAAPSEAS